MFRSLFARARNNEAIAYSLYGAIVAQARQPAFYADYGVPDTIDGRFDLVVLHAFLLFYRLKDESSDDRAVGQDVFNIFLKDMDRSLREIGIGDIVVPKRLKKMTEAFYGRLRAYDEALVAGDIEPLSEAITRNIFRGEGIGNPAAIATYVGQAVKMLAAEPCEALLRGEIIFPSMSMPAAA